MIIEKPPEAVVKTPDIERIIEMLLALSPERIKEAADFIDYLAERELKHKIFVEETLAAAVNPEKVTFNNSKTLIKAALESVAENS
ncbi:hypothetical protein [Candidatus Magnetomonas plexicatena]|uniref:hypothetical protein n=1 Tax=Candidatus Magnetomonas plexicatena TaxID=2552947 RepID=UPI001C769D3D|nr:hypothetical protein E2O03_002750 [Nitrospirales bacterium LBB_01]